jgi:hypothetical protein
LLPLALLHRWRQTVDQAATDVVLPSSLINRALTAMLAAEGWWLEHGHFPMGLSLLAFIRKA